MLVCSSLSNSPQHALCVVMLYTEGDLQGEHKITIRCNSCLNFMKVCVINAYYSLLGSPRLMRLKAIIHHSTPFFIMPPPQRAVRRTRVHKHGAH